MNVLKLPLGTAVRVRGMTGRDEDILTNRKKMQNGEAIDEIMANCVEAIGHLDEEGNFVADKEFVQVSDVLRLKTPDRVMLLHEIRRESFGDEVPTDLVCEACNTKFSVAVDLTQLPVVDLPDDYDPEFGYEVKLSDGTTVQFDYMNGNRERQLAKVRDNRMTMGMLARLGEVEGVDRGNRKAWLLNLPVKLRNELRRKMVDKECGVDTNVTADCTACGAENQFNVQGHPSFFFPET